MIPFADLKRQYQDIKSEIDQCIKSSLENTNFIGGSEIQKFENDFAKYLNINHCVACANGTDSIEILLKALGVGNGDEVIVPAISWISTSEAVSSTGAKPIFVDVDPDFYTICTKLIEEKITNKTKAIIPVHLYGYPANMKHIMKIARKYDLKVLEDCAQAHGANIDGKMVGTFGDAASFSFYPGKNLGAYGDAGGMVSNNEKIALKARKIANHGQVTKHNHIIEGRNSRLDALQASILNVKLPYLTKWIKKRNTIASQYIREIKNSKLKLPVLETNFHHAFHLFVIRCKSRDSLIKYLNENGIGSSIHYPKALPFLNCYKHLNYNSGDFPISFKYQNQILSIPMFPELQSTEIRKIINVLNEF